MHEDQWQFPWETLKSIFMVVHFKGPVTLAFISRFAGI